MNPKRNTIVTNGPWNCGGMSGHGIEGYILQPFRMRENVKSTATNPFMFRIQKGQLYDLNLKGSYDEIRAESVRLELLYGYAQYYCRNTCGFVMSRAAKRNGVKATEGMYTRECERYKGKRCPKLTFHMVSIPDSIHFHDYTAHTENGEYHINAFFDGKQCVGYRVNHANTKGKRSGGLWEHVGKFGTLKEARKACQKWERDNE